MTVAAIFSPGMLVVVLLVVYLSGPVLCVLGLVDVFSRADWSWPAAGQNKTLWLILNAAGIVLFFVPFAGVIIGLVYRLAIRPRLVDAEAEAGEEPVGVSEYGGYGAAGYGAIGSHSASAPPPAASPGWYPDLAESSTNRCWDGEAGSGEDFA